MTSTNVSSGSALRLPLLAALVVVAWMSGCGRGPEYGEVSGVVTRGGRPLEDVQVRFIPDPELGTQGFTAQGLTDSEGRYRLYSGHASRSGAVVGKHRVCVLDPHDPEASGKRVPPPYLRVNETPLRAVEVRVGEQTYDIDLPAKAASAK